MRKISKNSYFIRNNTYVFVDIHHFGTYNKVSMSSYAAPFAEITSGLGSSLETDRCTCSGVPYDSFMQLIDSGNNFREIIVKTGLDHGCHECLSVASNLYRKFRKFG